MSAKLNPQEEYETTQPLQNVGAFRQEDAAPLSTDVSRSGNVARRKAIFVMLAIANTCSTVVFSCIAPFYPLEARIKGADRLAVGIVFGIYELTTALMSPVFGRFMMRVGSRMQYCMGMCIVGCSSYLFGLLKWSPAGWRFFVLSILIRMSEACGSAAFVTASFSIVMGTFPGTVASKILSQCNIWRLLHGMLEVFSGLGFTIGPSLGGLLYEIGGFELPFWALGTFVIATGVLAYYVLPEPSDPQEPQDGSFWRLCKIPTILAMCLSILIAAASMAFFDPTLAVYLTDQFSLSSLSVGLMFMIVGATYLIVTPVVGVLVEKWECGILLMTFGSAIASLSFLLIGPSPLLATDSKLWLSGVSLFFAGLSFAMLIIPPVDFCLQESLDHGFPDGYETFGKVSGMLAFSFSLGGFLGPTVGSSIVHYCGFAWTSTAISFVHLVLSCLLLSLWWNFKRQQSEEKGETEILLT